MSNTNLTDRSTTDLVSRLHEIEDQRARTGRLPKEARAEFEALSNELADREGGAL